MPFLVECAAMVAGGGGGWATAGAGFEGVILTAGAEESLIHNPFYIILLNIPISNMKMTEIPQKAKLVTEVTYFQIWETPPRIWGCRSF